MSNLKRNTLALAVAAGMFLPLGAMAFDVTTDGDTTGEIIASQNGSNITMTELVELNADGITDNLIGRTTGFGVRLLVPAGITVVSGTLVDGTMDLAPDSNADISDDWVASAGIFSGNAGVWNLTPSGANATINAGNILSISALNLTGVPLTGSVVGTIQLFDPNTNAVIASANVNLISRANGVNLVCDPSEGDTDKKIDVASDDNQGPKILFTPNGALGEIGSSLNGNGENFFNAGTVNIGVTPNVTFAFQPGDTVNLTLTGDFDPAFLAANGGAVFLSSDALCSTDDVATSTINAGGTVATFTAIDPNAVTSAFVCLTTAGVEQIDSTPLTIAGGFTRGDDTTPFSSCSVLPLEFNGSVVKVFTFNPAGNTLAQSFLRVTNWGNTGGQVTLEGYDDGGNPGDSSIRFILPAGETVQLNSEDLENGNVGKGLNGAFGDGTGRWRMVVTAEFENLRVSSLNRNRDSGTVTNLTDADSNGEQVLNDSFGN